MKTSSKLRNGIRRVKSQDITSKMHPAWRRILLRHQRKTLGELCRRPKIEFRMSGVVIDFSDRLILINRFEWDPFHFNGYSVFRDADVEQHRFFTRAIDWRKRAMKKLGVCTAPFPELSLEDWPSCIASISGKFPLLTVHIEHRDPDVCYIGFPLKMTSKELVLDDLDSNCEWDKPRRIKLKDITRVDFDGGYERALAETAPKRTRNFGTKAR